MPLYDTRGTAGRILHQHGGAIEWLADICILVYMVIIYADD